MKIFLMTLMFSTTAFAQLPKQMVKCNITLDGKHDIALVIRDNKTAYLEHKNKICDLELAEVLRSGRNQEHVYFGFTRTSCSYIISKKYGVIKHSGFKLSEAPQGHTGSANLFYKQKSLPCSTVEVNGDLEKLIKD